MKECIFFIVDEECLVSFFYSYGEIGFDELELLEEYLFKCCIRGVWDDGYFWLDYYEDDYCCCLICRSNYD